MTPESPAASVRSTSPCSMVRLVTNWAACCYESTGSLYIRPDLSRNPGSRVIEGHQRFAWVLPPQLCLLCVMACQCPDDWTIMARTPMGRNTARGQKSTDQYPSDRLATVVVSHAAPGVHISPSQETYIEKRSRLTADVCV